MGGLTQRVKDSMNPRLITWKLNSLFYRDLWNRSYNTDGVDIFSRDWDFFIILDACRYDYFKKTSTLPGTLLQETSRGSTTKEFIRANFADRELFDTIYVSANGWFAKLSDKINADVYEFRFVERDAVNGLTSRPETVTDAALEAAASNPQKRIIVHYMQPHKPYLSEWARSQFKDSGDLYENVKRSNVSRDEVRRAYQENLELVLSQVSVLFEELDGMFVVSSDHGELLGELRRPFPFRDYGHPLAHYQSELIDVPWLMYVSGERRTIIEEEPQPNRVDDTVIEVEKNLRELGYL